MIPLELLLEQAKQQWESQNPQLPPPPVPQPPSKPVILQMPDRKPSSTCSNKRVCASVVNKVL